MDQSVRVVNVSRRATAPSGVGTWEQAILDQQDDCKRGPDFRPIGRRRTIAGIPEWGDFVNDWHERYDNERKHDPVGEHEDEIGSPRKHRHRRADSNVSQDGVFDLSSLTDKIHSKVPHYRTPKSSPKHKPTMSRPRRRSPMATKSSLLSPNPSRNVQSPKRGRDSFEPEAFDFDAQLRRDKSRFHMSQQQQQQQEDAKRSRRRTYYEETHPEQSRRSQMPKPEQFHNINPPAHPPPKKQQPSAANVDTGSLYRVWHDECDEQFRNKVTMTSIPTPPITACGACSTTAACSSLPMPLTCAHGLETLFRSAISSSNSAATTKTGVGATARGAGEKRDYFTLLKQERNRFHTDRFSACPAGVKAVIERQARDLFIMIQELLKEERKRVIADEAMKARAREGPAATAAKSHRWDDDEIGGGGREAW